MRLSRVSMSTNDVAEKPSEDVEDEPRRVSYKFETLI